MPQPLSLGSDPAPGAPTSMRAQLDDIHERCRELSAQHRLTMPAAMVRDRLDGLAAAAADMFQDRVIKICFLLDQHGSLRYNELRRALGQISTRTLALKLAYLQHQGIVTRTLHDENPPRVEYRLTPHGKRFTDLLFPALVHVGQGARALQG